MLRFSDAGQARTKQTPGSLAGVRKPAEKMLWGRRRGYGTIVAVNNPMERPMKRDDLSRSLVAFDQANTLVAVLELGFAGWLVAGLVPHLTRQPLKKLKPDPEALLALLGRWRDQATKAGGQIRRMVLAFEAGRDGFWLARWLRARGTVRAEAGTASRSDPRAPCLARPGSACA